MALHRGGADQRLQAQHLAPTAVSILGEELTLGLVVQGVIIGVVSSLVYLIMSYLIRPRIHICSRIIDASSESEPQFRFKVINFGLFSMIDVELGMELVTSRVADGNVSIEIVPLKLSRETLSMIPPLRPGFMNQSRSYAIRFRTFEDLASKWTDNSQHIRLWVKARHPMTGFTRLTYRNFRYTRQRPVRGDFNQGWRRGITLEGGDR
jgi:hypothetical protein